MASLTLADASKLGLNQLVSGLIDEIVTVDQVYGVLPFEEILGNAKQYTRVNALGDAQFLGFGDTITAKAQGTFTSAFATLSTIVGDVEIDARIMAQGIGANAGNDPVQSAIMSKAKSVARLYQGAMINGTAAGGQFDGLKTLVSAGQKVAGGALSFEKLDEMLGKVKSKGGQVDALIMCERDIRTLRALKRALGGSSESDRVMVNGVNMEAYAGVPVLRNDWIVPNAGESDVYAVNFEDGGKTGITGFVDQFGNSIQVENVGPMESKDQHLIRVKFYAGFGLYNTLGVSMIEGVTV